MALQGIDAARYNLQTASNKYADIQRQLDRYNKVFETYANASPETQMRAASVMRQALNEYNGLKKQQEQNTLKIYEAQNWINYFHKQQPQTVAATQLHSIAPNQIQYPIEDMVLANPTQSVQTVNTTTPGNLNNAAPVSSAEVNAIDTNQTMNVSVPTINTSYSQTVSPTTPVGVSNIIKSQTPQYSNTTIGPRDVQEKVIKPTYYGAGNVVATPGTGGIAGITTNNSLFNNRYSIIRPNVTFSGRKAK